MPLNHKPARVDIELFRIARAGGRLEVVEGDAPLSADVEEYARRAGLLRVWPGGGGWSEIYKLTNKGRIAFGLTPNPTMRDWLIRVAKKVTGRADRPSRSPPA